MKNWMYVLVTAALVFILDVGNFLVPWLDIRWVALIQALMAIEAFVSWTEGTWDRNKVGMTFWRNWAISFGGFIILPMVFGLIMPLVRTDWWLWLIGAILGLIVTIILYDIWIEQGDANHGHILYWYTFPSGFFEDNVTIAGWLHVPYMTAAIAGLFVYIFSPMPRLTINTVGFIFLAYTILTNIQAKVIQKSFRWSVFLSEMAFVALVTAKKLVWVTVSF